MFVQRRNPRTGETLPFAGTRNPRTGEWLGTGWLPPGPDLRDVEADSKRTKAVRTKLNLTAGSGKLPLIVDLVKGWFDRIPIENQGALGSCTAQATISVVEYNQLRSFGTFIDGSRLFLYKTTRNLMGVNGDTGAWLRNAMGALTLCGVPPEEYWPYTDDQEKFDVEPTAFAYSVADNYEAVDYVAHDPIQKQIVPKDILTSVKSYLAAGIPSVFGFYGFPSFQEGDAAGAIPYPSPNERWAWGHAVAAVGYDDGKEITNTRSNVMTTGALRIRNSWGDGWGEKGYGWLPYKYVENWLALDFWSLVSMKWVDTGNFGFKTK